jgi:hypothetical protein
MGAAQASEPREAQLIPLRCGEPATSGAIPTNQHPLSRNKCERERDARAQYPIYYAPLHALLQPPRPDFTMGRVWDSRRDRTSSIGRVFVVYHGRRRAVLHFTMPTLRPQDPQHVHNLMVSAKLFPEYESKPRRLSFNLTVASVTVMRETY